MTDVTLAGQRLEVFDFCLVVTGFQGDIRQGWAAGTPIGQKLLFNTIGPGQGFEHTDLAGQFG
ncbi:hypothetical protein D3C76_993890 [compost metagenome]